MTYRNNKQDSLGYFNMVRGAGILMVIVGHSMALFLRPVDNTLLLSMFAGAGRVIGSGVMAMFFMISGFYFQPRPMKRCIRVQARLLLKRYYLTAAAIIVVRGIRQLIQGKSYRALGARLFRTYLFGFNAPAGTTVLGMDVGTVSLFWFILALFSGWVLYNLICCLKSRKLQRVCVIMCVLAGWYLTTVSKVWPMAIPMGLMAVGYLAAGVEIRDKHLMERNLPLPLGIVVVVIALVCMAFGYVDMAACVWELGLLDVAGSFCMGYLLLRLYNWLDRKEYQGIFARMLENCGLHSIWIFCIHGFEKAMIPWEFLKGYFPDMPLVCMIVCAVSRICVIALLFGLLCRGRKWIRRRKRRTIVLEDYHEGSL